jgi:beta-barrel assembly-enhancing protease
MNQIQQKSLWLPLTILILLFVSTGIVQGSRKYGDIDKIGNRDINGRIFGLFPNFISFDKEIQLGGQLAAEFEQTAKLYDDPVITEYVDRIGQNIVRHSDARVPFHIKVVDTDEVNAFAFPGGYFYVNKGLILSAENESELAGVMAHEISHVTARHATERLSKAQIMQFAAIPVLFMGGWAGLAAQNGMGLGINLSLLGITRESEREADLLGIQYMWNAGYDPNAYVSFFEKLMASEKKKPGTFAGWFRTHPSTEDRIIAALDEQRFLPEKDDYMVDTSEFQRAKSRIKSIDNLAMNAESSKSPLERKRPTLKRRTGTGDEGGGEDPSGTQDGKPTLKKEKPTLKRPNEPQTDPDGTTTEKTPPPEEKTDTPKP